MYTLPWSYLLGGCIIHINFTQKSKMCGVIFVVPFVSLRLFHSKYVVTRCHPFTVVPVRVWEECAVVIGPESVAVSSALDPYVAILFASWGKKSIDDTGKTTGRKVARSDPVQYDTKLSTNRKYFWKSKTITQKRKNKSIAQWLHNAKKKNNHHKMIMILLKASFSFVAPPKNRICQVGIIRRPKIHMCVSSELTYFFTPFTLKFLLPLRTKVHTSIMKVISCLNLLFYIQ